MSQVAPNVNIDEAGKIKIGDWLIILLDDGRIRIWNDNSESSMVIKPRSAIV